MDCPKIVESETNVPGAPQIDEGSERIANSIVGGAPLQVEPYALGLSQHVHVANASGQDIYVLPSPNPAWLVADVLTDVALLLVGVTEIKSVVTAAELPKALGTFKDLLQFLNIARNLLMGSAAVGTRPTEAALALIEGFKKVSLRISAGTYKDVVNQGFLRTYFNASGYAGMLGAKTVSLTIMSGDGKQVCQFNTAPDHSWISTSQQTIVRAKYGTLWQESARDGSHNWGGQ